MPSTPPHDSSVETSCHHDTRLSSGLISLRGLPFQQKRFARITLTYTRLILF